VARMRTRRQVLLNILSTPLAASVVGHAREPLRAQVKILSEPHCLSEESATGFQVLVTRNRPASNARSPKVIIAPGARQLSRESAGGLFQEVLRGTWLILESGLCFMPREQAAGQVGVLRDAFGLEVRDTLLSGDGYIEYAWPLHRLVRDFSMFTPVKCLRTERIAEFGGVTACTKRRIGRGGIIFLGSMLGPGLLAEEREAHQVGSAMLEEIRKLSINV
jgi:hypothetical protein